MTAVVSWFSDARSIAFVSLLIASGLSAQEDPRWPQWPHGPFYRTDFGGAEIFNDWVIASGVWEVRNGVLRQGAAGR